MKLPRTALSIVFLASFLTSAQAETQPLFSDTFDGGYENWIMELPGLGFMGHHYEGVADIRGDSKPGPNPEDRFAFAYIELAPLNAYSSVLKDSEGVVRWAFNARTSGGASSLSGGGDGGGVIIAGSSPDFREDGVGYALVKGGNGTEDQALRFVKYKGGLAGEVTELATWANSKSRLAKLHNAAFCALVTFDPSTSTWKIQASATEFSDPLQVSYSDSNIMTVVDQDLTGESLPFFAFFCSADDTVEGISFDNVTIDVTVP